MKSEFERIAELRDAASRANSEATGRGDRTSAAVFEEVEQVAARAVERIEADGTGEAVREAAELAKDLGIDDLLEQAEEAPSQMDLIRRFERTGDVGTLAEALAQ